MESFFSKSGALLFMMPLLLFPYDTYEIKYEPTQRECTYFINLEYVARIDLNLTAKSCIFYLPKSSYFNCNELQSRNIAKSEITERHILLEADRIDKVAFNGYYCQ